VGLAAARREGILDDAALLRLATTESAAVARLPVGGVEDGAPADFLVTGSPERLLEGDRLAGILRRHPAARGASWPSGLAL
jgi:cytosine/adenosine deaminase-related metal-dependent hydrolase